VFLYKIDFKSENNSNYALLTWLIDAQLSSSASAFCNAIYYFETFSTVQFVFQKYHLEYQINTVKLCHNRANIRVFQVIGNKILQMKA